LNEQKLPECSLTRQQGGDSLHTWLDH